MVDPSRTASSSAASGQGKPDGSSDRVRFVIVAGARTGSTMLARALNLNPQIRCFGELFNKDVDFVPFDVDGYDNFDGRQRQLRGGDFAAFLRERIFPAQDDTQATGFKLLYGQDRDFPGLPEWLVEQEDLRVIHLRRRNLLRSLVSWKIADTTGVWVEAQGAALANRATLQQAARHPLRALAALRRRLQLRLAPRTARRAPVTLTPDECSAMFRYLQLHEIHYEMDFVSHPKLMLFYEDLLDSPEDTFKQAQSFLGVEPRPLAAPIRRQNPQPLRDLLANYEELYEAFRDGPYATFFE